MNKKERAEYERALKELAIVRALRWSEEPPKPDVPPPTGWQELSKGWKDTDYFEGYGTRSYASKMCSSSTSRGHGWEETSSQNPVHLYSTRLLALRKTRANAERKFAKILAEIDAEIDAELRGGGDGSSE